MTDRYAVIGHPIAHSKSPRIHAAFAGQTGQALEYTALLGGLESFEAEVQRFGAEGGRGLNVTVPFKHRAFALADELTDRARAAGAVNTLMFSEARILGDNTDGAGLLRDLVVNLRCELGGRRILLMGAGGAAFGVCAPLLQAAPAELVVVNRSAARAEALRRHFAPVAAAPTVFRACGYDALTGRFDVVVNATSAGLHDEMPALPPHSVDAQTLAYDMVYGRVTAFMRFARSRGATAVDGLGMLVEQAAESFALWRGVHPDTAPVIAALRDELGEKNAC